MVRVLACHAKCRGFKSRFSRLFKVMLKNYFFIFIFLLLSIFLSIIIYSLSFFLIRKNKDVEKLTSYECGFNPYDNAHKIFDIRFYLIAILFIVFDLEAAFVFPWALTLSQNFSLGFWSMIDFLIELIVGYIYIWKIGALEWN